MRNKGFSANAIEAALLTENRSRCNPPLPDPEVIAIARSIARYPAPEEAPVLAPTWPERMAQAAFYGLAGDIVRTISPHSEADDAALLVQTLAAFGNVIGHQARFAVESDYHYSNLFTVLVGQTAKGRKGTSWKHIERLFSKVDPTWVKERIKSGLASGEGLVWNTRDAKGKDKGVADKRLLDMESEFASVLQIMRRDGNIVSAVARQAWDSGALRTLNKNSPATATDAHISIIGHITAVELRRYITETEMANGFVNRILWVAVRRSKYLPEGSRLSDRRLSTIVKALKAAVSFGQTRVELKRDLEAGFLWNEVYAELSDGKPGLFGAVISRSEAQVLRVAMLYALLDRSNLVKRVHLEAALALWKYSEASAKFIFGDSLGDPTADETLRLIRAREETGITRAELSNAFGRHKSSYEIARALGVLANSGLAFCNTEKTDGRSAERWFPVGGKGQAAVA
jgi:hypothetical protein